jgi:hypothetical protein
MRDHLNIFVSCSTYALSKQIGGDRAGREFAEMCASPTRQSLPAARVIARLRELGSVQLFHVHGTCLPKMRSRAAHQAIKSEADLWVQVDDDVDTDLDTLTTIVAEASWSIPEARAVVLPCRLRGTAAERNIVNVRYRSALINPGHAGGLVRTVEACGTGLLVLNRAALLKVTQLFSGELLWRDDDGELKVALFEMMRSPDGAWLNEDLSFAARLGDAGIPIVAPHEGISMHDGAALKLEEIP